LYFERATVLKLRTKHAKHSRKSFCFTLYSCTS